MAEGWRVLLALSATAIVGAGAYFAMRAGGFGLPFLKMQVRIPGTFSES
jgi:hypothetical protein